MPSFEIHKSSALKMLKPRREPYWGPPLSRGWHVGFRKSDGGTGSWIARFRSPGGKQLYKALGDVSPAFTLEEARAEALKWFGEMSGRTSAIPEYSVETACRDYVTHLRNGGADANAEDCKRRFERSVYGKPFGQKKVPGLQRAEVTEWRNRLERANGTGTLGPSTKNRTCASVIAALNYAAANTKTTGVTRADAAEWFEIGLLTVEDNRRDVYVELEDRRRWLECMGEGDGRDYVEIHHLTGCRPGDPRYCLVKHFNPKQNHLRFPKSKTGPRDAPLHDAAVTLLKRRAKGKTPNELLFTNNGRQWVHYDWHQLVRLTAIAAKIPRAEECVLYTFRHCWITDALTVMGLSTLEVARITGTSVQMIEKHYGHLVSGRAREKMNEVKM